MEKISVNASKKCSKCQEIKDISCFIIRNKRTGLRRKQCKSCIQKARKLQPRYNKWFKENPRTLHNKFFKIKKNYGLTEAQYWGLFDDQNGTCALCKEFLWKGDIHVDHCHKTGQVRGLLHPLCNVGLGSFRDDIKILKKAIAYLQKS